MTMAMKGRVANNIHFSIDTVKEDESQHWMITATGSYWSGESIISVLSVLAKCTL